MGRKPLSDIAKESQLRIRLTEVERAVLDKAAAGAGLSTSAWARGLLMAAASDVEQPKKPARKAK